MSSLKKVIDTLDSAAESFDKIATKAQKKIYDEVINLAKAIETDAQGKVKQSIANLKRLTTIKSKLSALAKDKEWVDSISQFAQYFGILQQQQNAYFTKQFPSLTLSTAAKQKHQLMKQIAVQNTIDALIGDGLKANVTDKLNDILLRAVTTNEKFSDLQEELRAHLLGKDGGQGAFARYATTYATTALSQFTGQNNKLLTDDLDTEWFMYTGSNIETTREFCQHLTEKKYIHRSEIPTILAGKIDDHQCAIYAKTGLPYGMIEGTTPENFQVNCGGWNCRHQLVPVADAVVPAELRAKFDKKETQNDKKIPIAAKNSITKQKSSIQKAKEKQLSGAKKQTIAEQKIEQLKEEAKKIAKLKASALVAAKLKEKAQKNNIEKQQISENKNVTQQLKVSVKTVFREDDFDKERKNAAMFAKNPKTADERLREKCGKVWKGATKSEQEAIFSYTEDFYNFNMPLRNIGFKEMLKNNIGRINDMTSIIDKSSYDFDIWLQRGASYKDLIKFGIKNYETPTDDEIKSLVGKIGIENAFLSTSTTKGKGFTNRPIIFNIYAPRGTRMMYAEPFSYYGGSNAYLGWNGTSKQMNFGDECEVIIQRGTTYRVTKVEKVENKWYIDLDIISQNPLPLQ